MRGFLFYGRRKGVYVRWGGFFFVRLIADCEKWDFLLRFLYDKWKKFCITLNSGRCTLTFQPSHLLLRIIIHMYKNHLREQCSNFFCQRPTDLFLSPLWRLNAPHSARKYLSPALFARRPASGMPLRRSGRARVFPFFPALPAARPFLPID